MAIYFNRIVIIIFFMSLFGLGTPILPSEAATKVDNSLYNQVLAEFVTDGLVDYKGMKADPRLDEYLAYLSTVKLSDLAPQEKLSFWINTYNAFTLKLIKDAYPVRSINDLSTGGLIFGSVIKKTVWDKFKINIDDNPYSLNQIEHKIIRKEFNEPRIHFAVVCAAISCPPLRSEAFEGDRLDQQLDQQARIFLNNPNLNWVDTEKKEIYLSSILSWYIKDFADTKEGLLLYVLPYWPENIRRQVEPDIKSWKLRFTKYDWSLNERKSE